MDKHFDAAVKFRDRLHDDAYAAKVAEQIDMFVATCAELAPSDIISDQLALDMIETYAQLMADSSEIGPAFVTMFMLGAYLQQHGKVNLTTRLQ